MASLLECFGFAVAAVLFASVSADQIRHAQPSAMAIASESCGSGFGRVLENDAAATAALRTTAFPVWAGCAETFETKEGEGPPLVLRCTRGHITAIDEAVLGRPSGRCEPAAFAVDSEDERQQAAVEYSRPADEGICSAVDFRSVAASHCVGHASCTLELSQIISATNTHPGSCYRLLLRAAARFRCGTERDRLGGEGHRDVAWFDEDLTRSELRDALAAEQRSRGYAVQPPVYAVPATAKHPVACGFAYEGDFLEVCCSGGGFDRLPDDTDALAAFDGSADPAAPLGADDALVIAEVVAGRYGTFDGECRAGIDLRNPNSFPEMMCGVDVADYASAQCVGKASCTVYSPPPGQGDPCPSHKKAFMIVARCAPAAEVRRSRDGKSGG